MNRIGRILQSRNSAQLAHTDCPRPAILPKPSIVERLEKFFAEDLPSNIDILPREIQETATPARCEITETPPGPAVEPTMAQLEDKFSVPSDFLALRSVRLAAEDAVARSQNSYREIETNLQNHVQEFLRRQEALTSLADDISASLQQLQVKISKDFTDELEKASQTLLSRSAMQLQEQADAAVRAQRQRLSAENQSFVVETQNQFEELRASGQAFVDDTQKHLIATARSSLDSLANAAVEKARAEFDASKEGFINESQKQLALMSRTSLESHIKALTNDQLDQVRTEVTALRQVFIGDLQNQLTKMEKALLQRLRAHAETNVAQTGEGLMASHKQVIDEAQKKVARMTQASLESLSRTTVDQARKQLGSVLDEFLAKGIPQTETELRRLVKRHSEAAQTPVTSTQSTDVSQTTPVYSQKSQLQFALAESAARRRNEVGNIFAGLIFGMKLGVALGVMVLAALAIYFSALPVTHLRVSPPVAFFDKGPSWTTKQRAREDRLARAYWDIAVHDIAAKYGSGTSLPADPPESFRFEEKGPSDTTSKVDAAARIRYWNKLREIWPQSDSWERTSGWNLEWIRNAWDFASSKIPQVFSPSHTSAATTP